MESKKSILSIAIFLLIAFVIAGCGVIPTQPKGAIEGRVLIPPAAGEMSKDVSGWVPAAGATVTVVDANGVTHTVTTDEDGYYSFENIAVNPNTVVTATVEVDGKTIVLKKVIPDAVAEDEDYDAGTMTPESTALALVVETLVDEGVEPEDIYLGEILGSDSFEDLVENVTTAIEEEKDVTEDPDVTGGAGDTADEILNPPAPPSPPSGPSTVSVTGVTLDKDTLTLTAGGETGTLVATVAPENATKKNVTWTSSNEAVATVVDGVVTPLAAGTATITVTTEDGGFTVTCKVTVEAATTDIPVVYYTGKDFNRSDSPIVDSSGNVVQTINADGSISIEVVDTEYVDSGFVVEAGLLGDLGSITVEGSGDYGLNLYFDEDGDGEFFNWSNNEFLGAGSDRYALYLGTIDSGTLTVTDSTEFLLVGGGGTKTLSELKAEFGADTSVGIWVGVTSSDGAPKAATINSVTVE